jgi:hypothetical protein
MPSVVIVVAFALLCARECTALPWLTFIIAPVVSLALGTLAGILYWLRSSALPGEHRRRARRFILLSIVWGPVLGLGGFYAAMAVISMSGMILSLFS